MAAGRTTRQPPAQKSGGRPDSKPSPAPAPARHLHPPPPTITHLVDHALRGLVDIRAAARRQRVHLVKEEHAGRGGAGAREQLAHRPLALAHIPARRMRGWGKKLVEGSKGATQVWRAEQP